MQGIRFHAPRLLPAFVMLLSSLTSHLVFAEDLFDGTTARAFAVGSSLSADSTIGGYAIYQGDNNWRMGSIKKNGPNNFGVSYGFLQVVQYDDGVYAAEMVTTVNLNQSGLAFYMTSDPCGGEHLVKVNNTTPGRGDSSWDNCLTVDPFVATIRGKQITTIHVKVSNTQEGSRYYQMNVLVNPALLGFPGTFAADWKADSVAANPERKQFIDKVTAFGKQLQVATSSAMAWAKPKDAFKNVPSWRSLAVDAGAQASTARPDAARAATPTKGSGKSVVQRLTELKELLDKGMVTLSEYESKRADIINGL